MAYISSYIVNNYRLYDNNKQSSVRQKVRRRNSQRFDKRGTYLLLEVSVGGT